MINSLPRFFLCASPRSLRLCGKLNPARPQTISRFERSLKVYRRDAEDAEKSRYFSCNFPGPNILLFILSYRWTA
jgi:hypothetical protein